MFIRPKPSTGKPIPPSGGSGAIRSGAISIGLLIAMAAISLFLGSNRSQTGHAFPLLHKARQNAAIRQHQRAPVAESRLNRLGRTAVQPKAAEKIAPPKAK